MFQPLNMQIQNIKLQMNSIQTQIENIENQIINMGTPFIGGQMQNLGIQMLNVGIQMLMMGIQSPNMNSNNINIQQQIKNIETQLQIIEININKPNYNPFSPIQNMGLFNNNFNMILNKNKNNVNSGKINIIFVYPSGKKLLVFNYGTTVNDIFVKFLKEIGKSEYINTNYTRFIYNSSQLEFGDETKIEEKFRDHLPNPVLTVIDTYGHPL